MRTYTIVLMLLLGLTGCLKEDHFGYSSDALITEFKVDHQIGDATIDIENKTIVVKMLSPVFLSDATIKKISFSSFAHSTVAEGSVLDLTSAAFIQVIAEDGSESNWLINAE